MQGLNSSGTIHRIGHNGGMKTNSIPLLFVGLASALLMNPCGDLAAQQFPPSDYSWSFGGEEPKWAGDFVGPSRFADGLYSLDGSSRYELSGGIPNKALPKMQFSVESWVRLDRTQAWGAILSAIQDNGTYERGWMVGVKDSQFCFGLTSSKTNRLTYLTSTAPIQTGSWH
ncbi:MAG: hypothetical protein ACI9HK_006011, partial [Pirellulaceae bacterium]